MNMNYIKTIVAKSDYKEVEKMGNKYVLHILPEDQEDGIICVECMIDHEPTATEMATIKADAEAYYAELQKKADAMAIKEEVADLKQKLTDTDYIAIKYAEGWITAEDYAPTKAQRQQWRDRINELQQEAETVE